jgi:hypothetical protein
MPEPNPYPFCSMSSNKITINPDAVSWIIINIALPIPIYDTDPYAPLHVYANASPNAIIIANSFCEP